MTVAALSLSAAVIVGSGAPSGKSIVLVSAVGPVTVILFPAVSVNVTGAEVAVPSVAVTVTVPL